MREFGRAQSCKVMGWMPERLGTRGHQEDERRTCSVAEICR